MGHRELLDTLRAGADASIQQLWQETRARAEAMRVEAASRAAMARERCGAAIERESQLERGRVLFEARRKAQVIELEAEAGLRERLFKLAGEALAASGQVRSREFLERLALELPEARWKTIRVNPADREVAGALFPGSEVIADPGISGGLVAMSACGRLTVLATLEKRLELLWNEILPVLMREAREAA